MNRLLWICGLLLGLLCSRLPTLDSRLSAADPLAPSIVPGRSIVPVQVSRGGAVGGRGSAVLFDEGQHQSGRSWALLTAAHVVKPADPACVGGQCPLLPPQKVEVWLSGMWRVAIVHRYSKYADVAILTAQSPDDQILSCLAEQEAPEGAAVIVAGMSLGLEYQAHPSRVTSATGIIHELICTKSVTPGESGGGVFDARGDLVGILISHQAQAPWEAQYVSLPELRRFVAAAWSKEYAAHPEASSTPGPQPRLAPERGETREESREPEPKPLPAPEPKILPQSFPEPKQPPAVEPENPVIQAAGPQAPPPVRAQERFETREESREPKPLPSGSSHSSIVSPPHSRPWWQLITSGTGLALTIAGAVASGGIGGVAVIGPAWKTYQAGRAVLKGLHAVRGGTAGVLHSTINPQPPLESEVTATPIAAPFPRQLDEARQLLRLRTSEGRVPLLDSLRGVFLDDELDKLSESADPLTLSLVTRLRSAIEDRVNSVAPLSVKV